VKESINLYKQIGFISAAYIQRHLLVKAEWTEHGSGEWWIDNGWMVVLITLLQRNWTQDWSSDSYL